MKTQRAPVTQPTEGDREALADFAASIQSSLADLFFESHSHIPQSTVPAATDGAPGDVRLVTDPSTGNHYIYARFAAGWFSVQLT